MKDNQIFLVAIVSFLFSSFGTIAYASKSRGLRTKRANGVIGRATRRYLPQKDKQSDDFQHSVGQIAPAGKSTKAPKAPKSTKAPKGKQGSSGKQPVAPSGEVAEPPTDPPPTVSATEIPKQSGDIVAAWYQCTSDTVCNVAEGFGSAKDCGYPDAPYFDCPDGESCEVFCSALQHYCYEELTQTCTALPNAACNCEEGLECLSEHSFQCGPRVCKNTTLSDFESCFPYAECTDISDCGGSGEMQCVAYYQSCGFAV